MLRTLTRIGSRTFVVIEVVLSVLVSQCGSETSETTSGGQGGSGAEGGAGGEAGAGGATSTTSSTSDGGSGGAGGAGGEGGQGGSGGSGGQGGEGGSTCVPNPSACVLAPGCGMTDDGCGGMVDCAESCDGFECVAGECQCPAMEPIGPSEGAACEALNGGAPYLCGDLAEHKIPAACAQLSPMVWCCPKAQE